jgi:hypothetical protein
LENNNIGEKSKPAICRALRSNWSLENLLMGNSLLTRERDGPELMTAWEQHPSLTFVTFFTDMIPISNDVNTLRMKIMERNENNKKQRKSSLFEMLFKNLSKSCLVKGAKKDRTCIKHLNCT